MVHTPANTLVPALPSLPGCSFLRPSSPLCPLSTQAHMQELTQLLSAAELAHVLGAITAGALGSASFSLDMHLVPVHCSSSSSSTIIIIRSVLVAATVPTAERQIAPLCQPPPGIAPKSRSTSTGCTALQAVSPATSHSVPFPLSPCRPPCHAARRP